MVTNAHVVQGFKSVDVKLSGSESYQGEVLGVDTDTDLALLDLNASRDFEPVELGDSDIVAVGEEVIAVGYPLGENNILLGSPSVTSGIISARRASKSGVELLQTDAAINPGSSGGPLFDRDGRVVGVNTAKVFESEDGRPVEGIGLAVAINEVRDRLDLLARGGNASRPDPTQSTTELTPSPILGAFFASVSAGGLHSCSLVSDGSVICWGSNYDGKSTPPPDKSFAYIKAGGTHTCGVKSDGSIACWGSDEYGQSTPPDSFFISVTAGSFHTCGRKFDGSVACWGSNVDLGGNYRGQATPPSGIFISVSAGSLHSCGVHRDRSVECWGSNVDLDGIYRGQATPPEGTFTSVSAGGVHTCGVKTDGVVMCWGDDSAGQSSPPAGSFVSVSAGGFHTCGVKTNWAVVCWGANNYGQSTPHEGLFLSVSAGLGHTCGVKIDGSAICWGWNSQGQATPRTQMPAIVLTPTMVPTPTVAVTPVPTLTPVPSVPFVSVSTGEAHTCGLKTDGSVLCWGYNSDGQSTPPDGPFASVSAGLSHTCGVKTDGSVVCWGDDRWGAVYTTRRFIQFRQRRRFAHLRCEEWRLCRLLGL